MKLFRDRGLYPNLLCDRALWTVVRRKMRLTVLGPEDEFR